MTLIIMGLCVGCAIYGFLYLVRDAIRDIHGDWSKDL